MLKDLFSTDDTVHTWRPMALLVAMVLKIALMPWAERMPLLHDVLSAVVILGAVAVASYSPRALKIAIALAVPTLILEFMGDSQVLDGVTAAEFVFTILLYTFVLVLMIRRIFRTHRGTPEMIALSITCYLLIAHTWTIFYFALELVQPGAFARPTGSDAPVWFDLYYFSFVTMTTLGYGDVTPAHAVARSLAILEALTGVFFLGILIARLIGTYQPAEDDPGTVPDPLDPPPDDSGS